MRVIVFSTPILTLACSVALALGPKQHRSTDALEYKSPPSSKSAETFAERKMKEPISQSAMTHLEIEMEQNSQRSLNQPFDANQFVGKFTLVPGHRSYAGSKACKTEIWVRRVSNPEALGGETLIVQEEGESVNIIRPLRAFRVDHINKGLHKEREGSFSILKSYIDKKTLSEQKDQVLHFRQVRKRKFMGLTEQRVEDSLSMTLTNSIMSLSLVIQGMDNLDATKAKTYICDGLYRKEPLPESNKIKGDIRPRVRPLIQPASKSIK